MDDMREFTELTESEASEFTRYSVGWPMRDYIKKFTEGFVLEAACGNGNNTSRYSHDKYLGVDISPTLLEAARKSHPKHHFECYDISHLPFESSHFDTVLCTCTLSHLHSLRDARDVLQELVRVSKIKVVLYFNTPPTSNKKTSIVSRIEPTHFGHKVWANHYNITDLISGIVDRDLVHIHPQHNTVWEIFTNEYSK